MEMANTKAAARAMIGAAAALAIAACAAVALMPGAAHAAGSERLAGATALDTMRAISQKGWADGSGGSVVIATMGGYWDALTASGLAGIKGAPVLLTDTDNLSAQAEAEIRRIGAKTAYVAGGAAAVSDEVVRQIKAAGCPSVERFSGHDAIGTANAVYRAGRGSWGSTAVVATSGGFWDALSASPYAYARRAPVFLADAATRRLDGETLEGIRSGGFGRVIIAGGTAAVSDEVERQVRSLGVTTVRLAGQDAYETSAKVAGWCLNEGMGVAHVGVATGWSYYDALTGAALCGKTGSVLVLVDDGRMSAANGFLHARLSPGAVPYVFGGTAAVSPSVVSQVESFVPKGSADPVEPEDPNAGKTWVPDTKRVPIYEKKWVSNWVEEKDLEHPYLVDYCVDCGIVFKSDEELLSHDLNHNTATRQEYPLVKVDRGDYEDVIVGYKTVELETGHWE